MMTADYPNLELLEYKARQILLTDAKFLEALNERNEEDSYLPTKFEAIVFPQIWGSTCTGFDETEDGMQAIGGSAMTMEYTTVMKEVNTSLFIIFFGCRVCYKVVNPNEAFFADLKAMEMASFSDAKRRY